MAAGRDEVKLLALELISKNSIGSSFLSIRLRLVRCRRRLANKLFCLASSKISVKIGALILRANHAIILVKRSASVVRLAHKHSKVITRYARSFPSTTKASA